MFEYLAITRSNIVQDSLQAYSKVQVAEYSTGKKSLVTMISNYMMAESLATTRKNVYLSLPQTVHEEITFELTNDFKSMLETQQLIRQRRNLYSTLIEMLELNKYSAIFYMAEALPLTGLDRQLQNNIH